VQTQTTIESVERTPSGAYKITFIGGSVAGTADPAIGDVAVAVAAQESPNPVIVRVEKIAGDKLEVLAIEEITEPDLSEPAAAPAAPPVESAPADGTLDEAIALARTLPHEVLAMEVQERLFRLGGLEK